MVARSTGRETPAQTIWMVKEGGGRHTMGVADCRGEQRRLGSLRRCRTVPHTHRNHKGWYADDVQREARPKRWRHVDDGASTARPNVHTDTPPPFAFHTTTETATARHAPTAMGAASTHPSAADESRILAPHAAAESPRFCRQLSRPPGRLSGRPAGRGRGSARAAREAVGWWRRLERRSGGGGRASGAPSSETRCRLTKLKRHRTNPNGTKSFGFRSSVRPANERRMFSGFRPTE